ncbi:LADA_0B02872g1_1 [Lachancea dasiensis]|uniref:LADA_0B02872g1_1 n=1 Tax=Lachancea dasiensis TaxID=1072105 RepID=A0A1G4IS87_9SACH|nr:LADA_0B02872g1_1 [Lachancea dasiensis]
MSIRPVNLEDFTETSFEDVDTTTSPVNWAKSVRSRQSSPLKETGGPPSSTSSESTTFSNNKKRYSTHTESDDDGEGFLDEFEEFRGKSPSEEVLKKHFTQTPLATGRGRLLEENLNEVDDEMDALTENFVKNTSVSSRNLSGITGNKLSSGRSVKQPQSMLNLRDAKKPSFRGKQAHELTNSRSASNLRAGHRLGPKTVRYKKSMPVLSKYDIIREEDEQDNYKDEFEEDLKIDRNLLQPQFLSEDNLKSPLNLSPNQYTITADDSLLTPQLHKRHREWIKPSQLNMFREPLRREKRGSKYTDGSKLSASHRLKTIKQEIDHNTPMKKGRMVYNPETLTWEGNEQALSKFRDVDSFDKKAIVIQGKPDLQVLRDRKSSTALGSRPRGKVVGRMMFDQENLRWVRIDGSEKDPFAEIPDYIPAASAPTAFTRKGLASKRSQSQFGPIRNELGGRFSSSATTRFHSLGATSNSHDPTFNIDSKTLERFYHEENRWSRKVGGWFIPRDTEMEKFEDGQGLPDSKNNSYMYEIRNMVISSARN